MTVETGLTKMNEVFVPMIQKQLEGNAIEMSPYQKMCILGALQKINEVAAANGIEIGKVTTNISSILLTVAALELNANAEPREVYFIARNHVVGKDERGYAIKQKQIEMGIEGDGNDALLRRFGRDVIYVHPYWQVKEGDEFEMPKHTGTKVTPPTWNESGNGNGKTLYIVYPIDFDAGHDRVDTQYFVTDRESVKRNLLAHCVNNLMFDDNKVSKIKKIKDFFPDHTLDEILDSDEMIKTGNISPAWREPQSRESMIVRKMRNNIVKKIPKQFSNGLMATQFAEHTDDHIDEVRKDVTENANMEVIEGDVEENVEPEAPQPSSTNTAYKEPVAATADTEPSEPDTKEDPF